jgi:hypothetical protein
VAFQLIGGVCLGLVAGALHFPFWVAACVGMLTLVAISSGRRPADAAATAFFRGGMGQNHNVPASRRPARAP